MEELREPLLGVAIGKKGVGKSYQTDKLISGYIAGNPSKGIKGRKVLIIDPNDEYTHIKAIALQDVVRFSVSPVVEARRIRPYIIDKNGNTERMRLEDLSNTLNIVMDAFSGGLLLVEDINRYVGDNMKQDVMGAIATNRHRDQDIILHYQGIGRIGPKVWQNLNWLRFHKITEPVHRHKNKFIDKYELLRITEIMVNNEFFNDNIRYFIYVDCDNMKLQGNIDSEKFNKACLEYLEENYSTTIGPMLRSRGDGGKKRYTYESALAHEKDRLTKLYLKSKSKD